MHRTNLDLLDSFPWHETPLGPREGWPVEMQSVVQAIMASEFPVCTGWGSETVQIYNDAYNSIFGDKHPASFGAPLKESWPEIWPFVSGSLGQVWRTGQPLVFRDTMLPLAKAGAPEECYLDFSYSAVKNLAGQVIGLMSIATETTESVLARRRQASSSIESDPEAQTIVASFSSSLRGVLSENTMDCRSAVLFRLSPENGMPIDTEWSIRADGDFIGGVRPAVATALSAGSDNVIDLPSRIVCDDSAARGCVVPIADSKGRLVAALVIVPDRLVPVERSLVPFVAQISQRLHSVLHASELRNQEVKQARAQMAEQSAMYRFLFDNIRDGAIYTATTGRPEDEEIVLAINRRASQMLGYAPDEAVGMHRTPFFFPEDRALAAALRKRNEKGFFVGDLTFRGKDGQPVPLEVTSNIFELEEGETRSVTIVRDIAARNVRDREREEQMRTEAIANLTRAVAHDFNNLLTVLLGSLEALEGRLSEDSDSLKLVKNSERAAEEAANLTSQLLAYSGRAQVKPRILEVGSFLQEIRPLLDSAIGEMNWLKIDTGQDPRYCWVDSSALTSGLINLVTNARHAMPSGGTLSIDVRTLAPEPLFPSHDGHELSSGRFLALHVRDEGTGIPSGFRDKVFEPYFTTKEVGDGTGLGLPTVLKSMRHFGGDLRLAPARGKGAEFQVLLPLVGNNPAKAREQASSVTFQGKTILYVEDNALVRQQTELMLQQLGFAPLVARHGREALEHARSDAEIDIVLTDLVMPGGLSGRTLASEMARLRPGLPVVITTGYDPKSKDDGEDHLAVLRKPYSRMQLSEALYRALVA